MTWCVDNADTGTLRMIDWGAGEGSVQCWPAQSMSDALVCTVRDAQQREAGVQAKPEDCVAQELVPLDGRDTADRNERNLGELRATACQGSSHTHLPPKTRTCNENRYIRTLPVTTTMTSSCTLALSKKVTNMALCLLSFAGEDIELAYTCRRRKV